VTPALRADEPRSPSKARARDPILGVIVVTYGSANVIAECLETLAASQGANLKIVVVDNASTDGTCETIRDWASGAAPFRQPANSPIPRAEPVAKPLSLAELGVADIGRDLGPLTLIRSTQNRGFAGGVNIGMRALADQADWFWVLNPDCATPPLTAKAYVDAAIANPNFSLMTSRTIYYDRPDRIQTDGGQVDRRTGVCRQRDYGALTSSTAMPPAEELDWVTGANMLVSRPFIARAGLMREDYFLYYEEVDWAFRREGMPLAIAPEAVVYHHGGTSIGTGSIDRRPSPFANYFNHRNRVRFARRFLGRAVTWAYLYGLAKAAQLLLIGAATEAYAIVAGMFELRPPASVLAHFSDPEAARLAFERDAG